MVKKILYSVITSLQGQFILAISKLLCVNFKTECSTTLLEWNFMNVNEFNRGSTLEAHYLDI
jgi:hypothetical protein